MTDTLSDFFGAGAHTDTAAAMEPEFACSTPQPQGQLRSIRNFTDNVFQSLTNAGSMNVQRMHKETYFTELGDAGKKATLSGFKGLGESE